MHAKCGELNSHSSKTNLRKNSIPVKRYDILNEMWYEIEFSISQLHFVNFYRLLRPRCQIQNQFKHLIHPRLYFSTMSIVYLFVSVRLLYVTYKCMSENTSVELMFMFPRNRKLNKAS